MALHYAYILWNSKSGNFYYGSTADLKKRFDEHNKGLSKATALYAPWQLVFYVAFENRKLAEDFERYVKSDSGRALQGGTNLLDGRRRFNRIPKDKN